MILIIIGILLLVLTIIAIVLHMNNIWVTKQFQNSNIIVFGPKGKGKDLLFQLVIKIRAKKYKENYISTQNYGYTKKDIVQIHELNLNNDYNNMITNSINQTKKKDAWEGIDYYISDAGIYLPSQYDNVLSKYYKSLPIFYATSRHLYDMNIHINTQALNRVWIKLREQADGYIRMLGVINLPFVIIFKTRYYELYESANSGKLPMSKVGLMSSNNALYSTTPAMLKAQFNAENGIIRERYHIIFKKHIKYDTRYFHKLFFGKTFKEWFEGKGKA